jgi:hypothetical protein
MTDSVLRQEVAFRGSIFTSKNKRKSFDVLASQALWSWTRGREEDRERRHRAPEQSVGVLYLAICSTFMLTLLSMGTKRVCSTAPCPSRRLQRWAQKA